MLGVIDKRITEAQDPVTLCPVLALWGDLGVLGEFGHVFSLISATNQSGGATRVALF